MKQTITKYSTLIPYAAVLVGMYGFGSAWVAIIAYHIGMVATMLLIPRREPVNPPLKVHPLFYTSIPIYASGGLILYLAWPYVIQQNPTYCKLCAYGINYHIWPYFAVYFCLVNATIEELFWRWYHSDDRPGLTLNDFLFGGYHMLVIAAFTSLIWTIPVLAVTVFAGWLWRTLRRYSAGMGLPVFTHIVADLGIIVAVHYRLFH